MPKLHFHFSMQASPDDWTKTVYLKYWNHAFRLLLQSIVIWFSQSSQIHIHSRLFCIPTDDIIFTSFITNRHISFLTHHQSYKLNRFVTYAPAPIQFQIWWKVNLRKKEGQVTQTQGIQILQLTVSSLCIFHAHWHFGFLYSLNLFLPGAWSWT